MPQAPAPVRIAVERLMLRDLRQSFRRVVWLGEPPQALVPPDQPVVLFANHHHFHDGYLMWLVVRRLLGRTPIIWMREWDRVPIFGPIGAVPFPDADASQRLSTIRSTARRLQRDPRTTLVYFPEGAMGTPDAGLSAFGPDRFDRLARLFPPTTLWWPVAVRLTWWHEARPVVLLTADDPYDEPDGQEAARLETLLDRLESARPDGADHHTILEGNRGMNERWNLSHLAPLFRRWL